jgi:aminoglycoside phosphotransferase (APT) family kinase protein
VPEIIWHDSRFVIMQYIRGTLLTDLLASPGGDQELWIEQLADWLKKLHGFINSSSRVCLCKSDLNLRNFIFDGREFYGLDFEDVCFYPPERDLGGICAFILNNDPMFEQWKYQICSSLIKAYERAPVNNCFTELDLEAIWYYLIEELKAAASRREKQRDILNGKIKEMIALQKTSAGLKDFLIGS